MTVTYRSNVNELTIDILTSIKTVFKDKTIEITVSEAEMDETEYLLSSPANRQHLARSIRQLESGQFIKFTLEEFLKKYCS